MCLFDYKCVVDNRAMAVSFWKCVFGPKLYSFNRHLNSERQLYVPNVAERYCNNILRSLSIASYLSIFTSPLTIPMLYKREYFERSRYLGLVKFFMCFGFTLFGIICIRGFSRMLNTDYTTFLIALEAARGNLSKDVKRTLSQYDFCFSAWPIEFRWSDVLGDPSKPVTIALRSSRRATHFEAIRTLPCQTLSYVLAHSIGRWLLYPGSVKMLQSMMDPMLLQGRGRLIDEYSGQRYKLQAQDLNEIDVMFIDRRSKEDFENGNTLVVCCEGNAGFYEVGIVDTPLSAKYSVLGWNHPGFGGSTGVPFPSQEVSAIDVVMQFAIHRLGFKIEDIVVYAWSIGGFTGTWAAMNYPHIKGLVLDATFDDLVPMAVSRMPRSWKSIVVNTVRNHLNLDIAEQLIRYHGPVLIVRRTRDEIITTEEVEGVAGNRGNILLLRFLQARYPKLDVANSTALREWLSVADRREQSAVKIKYNVDEHFCKTIVRSSSLEEGTHFPSTIGENMSKEEKSQLIIFLASKYMIDFDASHCIPLPVPKFQVPTHICDGLEVKEEDVMIMEEEEEEEEV